MTPKEFYWKIRQGIFSALIIHILLGKEGFGHGNYFFYTFCSFYELK